MSSITILLELFTFLGGFSIGIYVFFVNPKSSLHRALALSAIGMAGWNLSIFLILAGIVDVTLPARLSFTFGALLTAALAWFVFLFPVKIRWYKQLTIASWLLGGIFVLIPLIPSFLTDPEVIDGHIVAVFNDTLLGLWTLYYTGFFTLVLLILLIRIIRAHGVSKARMIQVMIGFLLYFIPSLFTNLLLPVLFDDWRWNNLGPVFTIFPIIFLANAVLRYRLLNIRWVLGKSLVFSGLTIGLLWLVTTFYLLVTDLLSSRFSILLASLLIALTFKPFIHFFEKISAKIVGSGSYDPIKSQEEIFEVVRTEGDLGELMTKLISRFKIDFSAKEIAMVVFGPDSSKVINIKQDGFSESINKHVKNLRKLAKETKYSIVEKGEISWKIRFPGNKNIAKISKIHLQILEKAHIQNIIPFVVDGRLVGLLLIGERKQITALRSIDIQFLELVRSGISPALENAAKLEQTQKLLERLSELDKAKSEFINIVSHRFRTPLSAIRWNLETVLDVHRKKIGKEVAEALSDSQDRTLFLVETLDRLFDSLAIESGKLKLHNDYFNTKDAFTQATGEYGKRCKEKGVDCKIKIKSFEAWGDTRRLSSVLRSLMSNALQYTPTGGKVVVEISKVGNSLEFSVVDTGIGIPKTARKKIFKKFYRAKNAILTYADGQGLGMFYVKEITRLHKGKVELESELNKGTSITVSVPIKKKKAVKKKSVRSKSSSAGK